MADNETKEIKGYGHALFGRRVIYTDETAITKDNVVAVVRQAFPKHTANKIEINYLYNYYKGKQPILERIKEVRPEINNKVVVNLAYDIVDFKVSYLLGTAFSYVSDKDKAKEVALLNDYMNQTGKETLDRELVEWNHICGTAYRYVSAKKPEEVRKGDAPFDLYTLDPRTTCVIYSSTFKRQPMAAITYTESAVDNLTIRNFVVYTKDRVFTFNDDEQGEPMDKFITESDNPLGEIPIYEYPANNARLGAFEIVLPLLDAYNRVSSNDIDGIEQQIQSFLKFINCDLDGDALENLRAYGAIKIKSIDGAPADVDSVRTDYSYDGANITKEDIYRNILMICGMPVLGNGKSFSANNGAAALVSGFSQAEMKAKASETMFTGCERRMLNLVLKICDTVGKDKLDIKSSDIECKSPRTNYENLQVKAQVLCEMLNTPRVHPKLAFESCGLFSDPENAYLVSEVYYNEQLNKWEVHSIPNEDGVIDNAGREEETGTVRANGYSDSGVDNPAS